MLFLWLLALAAVWCVQPAWRASGRQLQVSSATGDDWEIFTVRGFSYSNARIGDGPPTDDKASGVDALMLPDVCQQDFPAMRALNTNAIKIYAFNVLNTSAPALHTQCLDEAWNKGHQPIWVVLSIWITSLPFASPTDRDTMINRYERMVNETRNHPAVMGYSIGSEIAGDPNNNAAYWSDFNQLVAGVRSALGSTPKIVTTGTYQTNCNPPACDPAVPVLAHVINGEKYHADVDVWGVDVYSPNPNEPNLRKDIFHATTKPLFFPEYGTHYQPPKDPVATGKAEAEMVQEMEQYSYSTTRSTGNNGTVYNASAPVYCGGMLFEWIDEYWKAPLGTNCKPNPASAQAWYGVNAVALKQGCECPGPRVGACALDQRIPRPILSDGYLAQLWPKYEPASYA